MTEHQGKRVRVSGWRTIGIQTAPPGWRLLSIFPEQPRDVRPIPVWLLQEERPYYLDENDEIVAPPQEACEATEGPDTRVIGGICVDDWGWRIEAIDFEGGEEIWKVLGPDEADPTDEEWDAEIARRRT